MTVTRAYLGACVGVTALVHAGVVTPAALALNHHALKSGQLWRLITPFCYGGGFTPSFLLALQMISIYGSILERLAQSHKQPPLRNFPRLKSLAAALLLLALLHGAAIARPRELQQPFFVTAVAFFCVTAVAYVPTALMLPHAGPIGVGIGGVRIRVLPWLGLIALGALAGPAAALQQMSGIGAALVFACLELFPEAEVGTETKAGAGAGSGMPASSSAPAASDAAAVAHDGAAPPADAGASARAASPAPPPAVGKRRNGLLLATAVAACISLLAGADLSPPPLPHHAVHAAQSARLRAALAIDASDPAAATFFSGLANATNLSFARAMSGDADDADVGSPPPARALGASQLLRLFQHCADFWVQQHIASRAFSTARAKRGYGGGSAKEASNAQMIAELERDLADGLSRVDFASNPSDRDVLKQARASDLGRQPAAQSLLRTETSAVVYAGAPRVTSARARVVTASGDDARNGRRPPRVARVSACGAREAGRAAECEVRRGEGGEGRGRGGGKGGGE